MARGRRLTPLFEVVRPIEPARPVSVPPPQPATTTSTPPPRVVPPNGSRVLRTAQQEEEADDSYSTGQRGGSLKERGARLVSEWLRHSHTISGQWLLGGVGALVFILLLTWVIAYKVGEHQTKAELLPRVSDTGSKPPVGTGSGLPTDVAKPSTPDGRGYGVGVKDPLNDQRPAPIVPDAGRSAAPDEIPSGDVRQQGNNYLYVLTTARQADADAAAAFLTSNGIPAGVVGKEQVDPDPAKAKNPGRFQVFVLEGIPSSEYKHSARKAELETAVKRLGATWKKDPRGRVDFDSAGWALYKAPAAKQ